MTEEVKQDESTGGAEATQGAVVDQGAADTITAEEVGVNPDEIDLRMTMFNELETQIAALGSYAEHSLAPALQNLKNVL